MYKIEKIKAREILDSRDDPTIEVDVVLEDGNRGRASVPSGASTGSYEACELRDEDSARYGGKGVLKAVENVNVNLTGALVGGEFNQESLDKKMMEIDGTPNKSRLGANAILGVSLAFAKAVAEQEKIDLFEYIKNLSKNPRETCLPLPLCNVINGGKHTNWQSTDIQEFMIAPVGAGTFSQGVEILTEIFDNLKNVLERGGYNTMVGDEGGFAPKLKDNEQVLDLISEAVKNSSYKVGQDIFFALDVAAGELKRKYDIGYYRNLVNKFPIFSVEDPFPEDDWEEWKKIMAEMGDKLQIVGDDLLVTNVQFLDKAIREKAANAILIKPNQIGTLSETIAAVDLAHQAGWRTIISHRSGETEDTTIAHIAVGLGSGQIKIGSVSRTDRTSKYNEILRIEEKLGEKAKYAGSKVLKK